MEHFVQFGISIDDEGIKRAVAQNAEKTITKNIQDGVEKVIFERNPWGDRRGLSHWAEKVFCEFLEANKERIIEAAAIMLSNRLSRTKAVKEMVSGEISKMEEGGAGDATD